MRNLDELCDPAYLKRILSRSVRAISTFSLKHSPVQLWPFVSNTDMINKRTGLPAVAYSFRKNAAGGTFVHGKFRVGPLKLDYEELPFEWLAPRFLRSDRVFQNGPLRLMRYEVELSPLSEGGAGVRVAITISPWFIGTLGKPIIRKFLGNFEKVYRDIDSKLGQKKAIFPAVGFLEDGEAIKKRARALAADWKGIMPDSPIPLIVAEFISSAPDRFLRRIRPFELASQHSVNRLEMLKFFLAATRKGYLNMSWDILCPSCGGDKAKSPSLGGVTTKVHCDSCDIDYGAAFDRNVEVTFSPATKVRDIGTGVFCFGNPANTTHVVAQHSVDPGEVSRLSLVLSEGRYRLRSPTVGGRILFQVTGESKEKACLEAVLNGELSNQGVSIIGPSVEVEVSNPKPYSQTVRIENLWWLRHATTAAFVTSLQDFRDMFSSEALAPGIQLGISNLAIMFTDLKGSTSLYDTFGDAKAFSLVQSHFDILHRVIAAHMGGIVKTIGDAVMAVFQRAEYAFEAGLAILYELKEWNAGHDEPDRITIKLGFYEGPCIALTLNEKLDYFGSTVNRANRVQDQSRGGEMVLPDDIFHAEPVQDILKREAARGIRTRVEKFEASLKGFAKPQLLYRVSLAS
jgi:class 3 adenylate cyclase